MAGPSVVLPLGPQYPPALPENNPPPLGGADNFTPGAPAPEPSGYAATIGKTVDTITKLGGFGSMGAVTATGMELATGAGPGETIGATYDAVKEAVTSWVWYAVFAAIALAVLAFMISSLKG